MNHAVSDAIFAIIEDTLRTCFGKRARRDESGEVGELSGREFVKEGAIGARGLGLSISID